jgi:serine/threonine protein kinase
VNEFGEAKLADFGCSKTMGAEGTMGEVAHGSIKGTPYFMAPGMSLCLSVCYLCLLFCFCCGFFLCSKIANVNLPPTHTHHTHHRNNQKRENRAIF